MRLGGREGGGGGVGEEGEERVGEGGGGVAVCQIRGERSHFRCDDEQSLTSVLHLSTADSLCTSYVLLTRCCV